MGLIRSSIMYMDAEMFRKLFTELVRPHMEYGSHMESNKEERNINRKCAKESN